MIELCADGRNSHVSVIVPNRSSRNKTTLKRSRYLNSRIKFNVNGATNICLPDTSIAIVDVHLSMPIHKRTNSRTEVGVPRPISKKILDRWIRHAQYRESPLSIRRTKEK